MFRSTVSAKIGGIILLTAACAIASAAQSQPDSQAGAQLGEQSALAGKQAQGANTQKTTEPPSGATSLYAGTAITAELTSSLDSKKVKQGDAVNARTVDALKSADGRTIMPKGTKLSGRVTQASARSAGQAESSLGLMFDKATLKSGEEIPLNVAVQAIGAAPSTAEVNQNADIAPMAGPSGQARGTATGVGSTATGAVNNTTAAGAVDNTVNTATGVAGNAAGTVNSTVQLNSNSRGVVGLNNLKLSPNAGAGVQGSLITSSGKNVHLDTGTRLVLVAQASAASQPAGQKP
jgi:hypothetical protein